MRINTQLYGRLSNALALLDMREQLYLCSWWAANTYGEIGVAPGEYRSGKQGQELSQCDNK